MNISDKGITLIKNYEGCRLTAYKCPSNILTIGYGHTGSDVYIGKKITQEEADKLFSMDLKIHENNVNKLVKVSLTQNQFDALVSLEYNIGYGNFKNSTILKLVNNKNFDLACKRFLLVNNNAKTLEEKYKGSWVFDSNKKVLKGLVNRRLEEQKLFAA